MSPVAPITTPGPESGAGGGAPIATAPCSQQQEAFWALDRLRSNPSALNIAVRWRLEGIVTPDLVERAFQQIIARHEVLRTALGESGGIPVQRIFPSAPFRLAVVDLSLRSEPSRTEKCDEIAANEARRPFNLAEPPLLRVTLVKLDERTSILLVTAHHTVCDGWSVGILSREFGLIYDALHREAPPQLHPLPIQYADFAQWQRECLECGEWKAAGEYWSKKLKGTKRFMVAPDRIESAVPHAHAAIASLLLPRSLTDRLQAVAKTQRCSFFSLAVAALTSLLHRLSGQTDITIGSQIAGRDQIELEGLIGVFINTLPLRCDLSNDPSFLDLLDQAQDTTTQALIHQYIPAEDLARLLKPGTEFGSGSPLPVNFIFQRSFIKNERHSGFSLIDIPSITPGALYDLNFFMVERPEGWRLSCEYNGDRYMPETVEGILRRLQTLFAGIATDPARRLSALPISTNGGAETPRSYQPNASSSPRESQKSSTALVVDASQAESALASIWQDLLHLKHIDPNANFFELGGHSLLAARMLARVEERFGKRLGLASLVDAPTLKTFAAHLAPQPAPAFALDIRQIQRIGAGTPILAINYGLLFGPLAARLGPEHRFTAVQLPGFDGREHLPFPPFDEIVEAFIEAFARECPEGPIAILGFCGSSPIAYEVAQRMRKRGREISLLVLIGAWAPGYVAGLTRRQAILAEIAYRIGKHRIFLTKVITGRLSLRDYFYGLGIVQYLRLRIDRWLYQHRFSSEMPLEALDKAYPPYLRRISHGYRPQSYAGPMLIVRASEEPSSRFLDPSGGWQRLAEGPIEIRRVEGDHLSIFEGAGVAAMADHIRATLGRQPSGKPPASTA